MNDKQRKQLGIMGGTFNPIHVGHLMLAEWAREAASLDEIIFIPTGQSYMKEQTQQVLSGEERFHMVKLAIEDREVFHCSDMEIRRAGNTYTYETMEELHKKYPDTDLSFIMGADCLFTIEKWSNAEKIFQSCRIIAAARNGSPLDEMAKKSRKLEQQFHGRIEVIPFLTMEISSTEIRNRIKQGKSIRYLVPEIVQQYILEQQLYR